MIELKSTVQSVHRALTETFVEALETMAFISPLPLAAPPADVPARLRRVSVSFTGPSAGSLEITTSEGFGTALAANLTGLDSADSDPSQYGDDALKELANVACGLLLRGQNGPFELAPPVLYTAQLTAWPESSASAPIVALNADGHAIVIRLRIDSGSFFPAGKIAQGDTNVAENSGH